MGNRLLSTLHFSKSVLLSFQAKKKNNPTRKTRKSQIALENFEMISIIFVFIFWSFFV